MARTADQLTGSEEIMVGELDAIENGKIPYKNSSGVYVGIESNNFFNVKDY